MTSVERYYFPLFTVPFLLFESAHPSVCLRALHFINLSIHVQDGLCLFHFCCFSLPFRLCVNMHGIPLSVGPVHPCVGWPVSVPFLLFESAHRSVC